MTSRNEITGDMIVSRTSNQDAYAANYNNIFRKNKGLVEDKSHVSPMVVPESTDPYVHQNIVACCGERGCGICETKVIDFEYSREVFPDGKAISYTMPKTISKCCGGDVFYWDVEKDEEVVV